ncbi:MAG: hypothetical protein JWQ75_1898, partial [Pseudarthrobacter sp.]|nr:hypothetical protein [Pseudarthrobacter sp.]
GGHPPQPPPPDTPNGPNSPAGPLDFIHPGQSPGEDGLDWFLHAHA